MATQHMFLVQITMSIIIHNNVYYIQLMTCPPFHYGALVSFLAYFPLLKETETEQAYAITILSVSVCPHFYFSISSPICTKLGINVIPLVAN
jgi:hypothetical protein